MGRRVGKWLAVIAIVVSWMLVLFTLPAQAGGRRATGPSATSVGLPATWPMYHLDATHTGNAGGGAFPGGVVRNWTSPTLDGTIYAEPVVIDGLVIVATENNSLYAVNANTGQIVWGPVNVGPPAQQSDLPCGNIFPLGITGTPVIDTTTKEVFAVAEVRTGPGTVQHRLFGVNADSGAMVLAPRSIEPLAMSSPIAQQQRPGLVLANGNVYVNFGGLAGDCGTYWGFVVGLHEDGIGPLLSFEVAPANNGGAIWASPGAAVDGSGNLWVATGNSFGWNCASPPPYDDSDGVIKLSPTLTVLDSFAPSSWAADDCADADLGSTSPQLVQGNLAFQVGKSGTGYLMDATSLGHVGGQKFSAGVCPGGAYGGDAYVDPIVYVPCTDGVRAVTVDRSNPAAPTFSVSPHGAPAGSPVVGAGLVWSLATGPNATLYALDPTTLATVLTFPLGGPATRFSTPTLAANHVYVASGRSVQAFGSPPFNGYVLDGWGGVHAVGTATPEPVSAYWPGWDIARGLAVRATDHHSGYVLDGWGAVHAFGGAPAAAASAYWNHWDIARGIALNPCDATGSSGYVLDGWGGVHPFGGAPTVAVSAYWHGWDIARGIAVNACNSFGVPVSGYVLDGWGGVHAFGGAPGLAGGAYWPGWDIARGVAVGSTAGQGWALDGWGGLHPFGSAPAVTPSAYLPGSDVFRGLVAASIPGTGFTMANAGQACPFGTAPLACLPSIFGFAIARGIGS